MNTPKLSPTGKPFRTPRQKCLYEFVVKFRQDRNLNPTIREAAKGSGFTSTSVANYNIQQMIADGWLVKLGDYTSRAIAPNDGSLAEADDLKPRNQEALQAIRARMARRRRATDNVIEAARVLAKHLEETKEFSRQWAELDDALRAYDDFICHE